VNIIFDWIIISFLFYIIFINPIVESYFFHIHEKRGEIYQYDKKIKKWIWIKTNQFGRKYKIV